MGEIMTGPMLYSGGTSTMMGDDSYVSTVAGEFVSNGGSFASGMTTPGGLIGSFDIGGTRTGSPYAATGSFGADNSLLPLGE